MKDEKFPTSCAGLFIELSKNGSLLLISGMLFSGADHTEG